MSVPGVKRESAAGPKMLGAGSVPADAGFTVSVVVRTTPASLAVMVTLVAAVTLVEVAVNPVLVAPAARVTLAGTPATAGALLVSVATSPTEGAALVSVTVPAELVPPVTLAGFTL